MTLGLTAPAPADDHGTSRRRIKCAHDHLDVDALDVRSTGSVGLPKPCGADCAGPTITVRLGDVSRTFTWGLSGHLASAAFWVARTKTMPVGEGNHNLAGTLAGEVVACILGGWGVKAEVGLAAFEELERSSLVRTDPPPEPAEVEELLRRPLAVPGMGGSVRYRFPSQRARRVAAALQHLSEADGPPDDPGPLRSWLQEVPGVGPKTAAWIVRNRAGVEDVAIIDVHVRRAGIAAGFFDPDWRLPGDYDLFEGAFLVVARLGGVSGSMLDACIWQTLHQLGPQRWPALLGDLPR